MLFQRKDKLLCRILAGFVCLSQQIYAFQFLPENATSYINPSSPPPPYNLTYSQYELPKGSSWWASSFLTATTGEQFVLISHVLTSGRPLGRSSVLRLDTLEYSWNLSYASATTNSDPESGPLSVIVGDYAFMSTSVDSISSMITYGAGDEYVYNITYEATTPVLLNGGQGTFQWGPALPTTTFNTPLSNNTITYEWGLPACRTKGSLNVNQTEYIIDPDNSLTWYDRQIGGAAYNWTWFELHFPGTDLKASIWAYQWPPPDGKKFTLSTLRWGSNEMLLSFRIVPDSTKTWTSPRSNLTYPLSWTLMFEGGDYLRVESVRPNQELYGSRAVSDTAYEGFVTATGSFRGHKTAYGIVEMVTV